MKFTSLKGLWLNGNPIEEMCHNFNEIGEAFDNLEIINSCFTSKAGEWAIKFITKDKEGPKEFEEMTKLDLSSRKFLMMKDLSIFSRFTSVTELDISDHEGQIEAQEKTEAGLVEKEDAGMKYSETNYHSTLHDFFKYFPKVTEIKCDADV